MFENLPLAASVVQNGFRWLFGRPTFRGLQDGEHKAVDRNIGRRFYCDEY